MSKIVTMRTLKLHRHGKSVNVNGIKVDFDKLGFVDVTERHVEELLKGGLKIVDVEDLKRFAKQRELLEKAEQDGVDISIDLHDENAKLKVENSDLRKENEAFKTKVAELENSVIGTLEQTNEDGGKEDDEDKSIDDMLKPELIELCKEIKFPEKEWVKLGVEKLKDYVKGKL